MFFRTTILALLLTGCAVLFNSNLNAQEVGFSHEEPIIVGEKDDIEGVKSTLRKLYNALAMKDSSTFSKLTTPDFYLLEQGEYWDKGYAKALVGKNSNNTHYVRQDYLNFRIIEIEGNIACAVWDLRADISRDGQVHTREWLESGWLKKIDGDWKVAILHSTRVEKN